MIVLLVIPPRRSRLRAGTGRGEGEACGQAGERKHGKQVPVVEVGNRNRGYQQDDSGQPCWSARPWLPLLLKVHQASFVLWSAP